MTSRAQARAEMTAQIKQIALAQLATEGPDLSLRAVARELGVVSSAVYRYFPSREALLTALIIEGYNDMADAAEASQLSIPAENLLERWLVLGRTLREWSLAQPHVYALLYGTPLPGYQAPEATIEPATRPVVVAMRILADGYAGKQVSAPRDRLPRAVRAEIEKIVDVPGFEGVPVTLLARALSCWAQLFGNISFELFSKTS